MADAHAKPHHDYHLVNPSPWPLVGSIFAFLTAVGLIMWMKGMTILGLKLGGLTLGIGIAGILYVMAAWWYDVIHEAETGDHTRIVQISHRYGMLLFIASEVMFFVAWFWAYFDASLFSSEAIQPLRLAFTGGMWPPKGTEVLDPLNLPLLNTLILLTSGTTITWAHHALLHDDRQGLKTGLALTIVLGLIFKDYFILALPADHRLATPGTKIYLRDLGHEDFIFIARATGQSAYDSLLSAFASHRITPRIVQESQSEDSHLGLVAAGMGLTFTFSSVVARYHRADLVFKPVEDLDIDIDIDLVWRRSDRSPLHQAFLNQIEAALAPGPTP